MGITPKAWLGKAHVNIPQRLVREEAERLQEAMLDEAIEFQQEQDTAIADSLVQQGEFPDPRDYAGLR
jgi:hypothetical protein